VAKWWLNYVSISAHILQLSKTLPKNIKENTHIHKITSAAAHSMNLKPLKVP
jgi:hypothetical protein